VHIYFTNFKQNLKETSYLFYSNPTQKIFYKNCEETCISTFKPDYIIILIYLIQIWKMSANGPLDSPIICKNWNEWNSCEKISCIKFHKKKLGFDYFQKFAGVLKIIQKMTWIWTPNFQNFFFLLYLNVI